MASSGSVVLVDEQGRVTGTAEKVHAHEMGALHLAISVVLYRGDGRVLLQQRAAEKYHFPLAWANACCSHPAPDEPIADAAHRRLHEELGIDVELEPAGTFVYRAVCPTSGLVEHELDHVYVGTYEGNPEPDPSEVAEIRWVDPDDLAGAELPGSVAPWLGRVLELAESLRRGDDRPR